MDKPFILYDNLFRLANVTATGTASQKFMPIN